ncbi:tRNA lysidine(34) synthetase TilS [Verrucomicrobiota bacterium]
MIKKIYSSIKEYRLFSSRQHILVAVSGGADSVALLYVLKELKSTLKIKLTAAHLNHCIRGSEADKDAAFVKQLAKRLRIRYEESRFNVPGLARRKGISLEMAAREARYSFLTKTARKIRADAVATAHTADDQAETVLLKLARGAGPGGLSGIKRETVIKDVKIIRPMLDVAKKEILTFLNSKKIKWREDKSNYDTSFLRNRIRHEIMPLLEARLNPRIKDALLRTAEIIREEDICLDNQAQAILTRCKTNSPCVICLAPLLSYSPALRRRVFRSWLSQAGVPPELIDFKTVDQIGGLLLAKKKNGRIDIVDNWMVRKQDDKLSIGQRRDIVPPKDFRHALNVPGETVLSNTGFRVVIVRESGLVKDRKKRPGTFPAKASIASSSVRNRRIYVRSWRNGDRMKPLGINGSKKVQDIFVDEKTPREQRRTIPLFECGGEIVWVPGYRVARGWEVKDETRPAFQIRVEKI